MNHRHLLPNEIDLLVDGEVGFGVAPLQAHIAECAHCRSELEEARQIAALLEELPRFAPSYGLADRVMAQVPVFVPWHVAARDALRGLVPQSRPLRAVALAGGTSFAAVLSAALLWVLARGDLASLAGGLAGDRVRLAVESGGRVIIGSLLGEQAFVAIAQAGTGAVALAAAGFLGAAAVALIGLRKLATASRRAS